MTSPFRYEIQPRPETLGGGWSLKLYEGDDEMGGGVFPPDCEIYPGDPRRALDAAFADAQEEGNTWLALLQMNREQPPYT